MSDASNERTKERCRNMYVAIIITVIACGLILLTPASSGLTAPHILSLVLATVAVPFWFGAFEICWVAKCPYCTHSFEVNKPKPHTNSFITCPNCEGVFKGKTTGLW